MNSATNSVIETSTDSVIETTIELQQQLQLISSDEKLSMKQLSEKINEIITFLNTNPQSKVRDRGPKSEKEMSESDAENILLGELKDISHKKCAEILKLSYGQIYSARKGFTFKNVYKKFRDAQK